VSDEQHKTPAERLLDLFVYGPAGLAATAAEEFPHLVAKGRHRVEGQLHAARLVGQFAVQMGRQQIEQTVGSLAHRKASPPAPGPAPASPSPATTAASLSTDAPASTGPSGAGSEPTAAAPSPSPSSGVTTAGSPNGTLASSALGIPGYDSLSASQVVQRLGGLSGKELEAVRGHEAAHRHRRTILNRVDQLLAGDGDGT